MGPPEWTYVDSIYLPKLHCLLYRDENLRVQLQIMTRRGRTLFSRKEKLYYFIDGVERVFRSESKMLRMLRKKWMQENDQRFSLIVHLSRNVYKETFLERAKRRWTLSSHKKLYVPLIGRPQRAAQHPSAHHVSHSINSPR